MKKKSILVILVIIILLAIAGAYALNQPNDSDTQVKVGSATFNLPNGFHSVASDKDDVVNITNGYDTLLLKECGEKNITKYTKSYVKNAKDKNLSVQMKNFTADNVVVYKSKLVNNTKNIHYWFEHDGNVYTCYTYDGNDNTDNVVVDLIKSLN